MIPQRVALVPDRLFTGVTEIAAPRAVIVEGGQIAAIDEPGAVQGLPVIRLPGATLLPGLIDAHTHVSIVPSRGDQLAQLREPLEQQLAAARANVLTDLLAGVTTLRVMGQELGVDFRLRDEIAAGVTPGPDLVCAGVQLAKKDGHGYALTAVEGEYDIQRLVIANASHGAGLIKIFATGGVSSVAGATDECPFSAAEIRCAADTAHREGLKLAAHAHGGDGALRAMQNGVDSIEHAALFDRRLIDEARRRNVAVVGTFSIVDHPLGIAAGDAGRPEVVAKLQAIRGRMADAWHGIVESGVRIAVGTDSMHGCLAFEIARLTSYGATPARALRAATSIAAEICGLADRGLVEPGRRADVVAVLGNPLEDIRVMASPVFVMKAGVVVHHVDITQAPAPLA